MPHIDNDVKLDFKDVLLRPKRSTLKVLALPDAVRKSVKPFSIQGAGGRKSEDGLFGKF